MPADAPRPVTPQAEQLARAQLVDALREALGSKGASAQQMRRLRAGADAAKADKKPDKKPDNELLTVGVAVAKAAIGHLVLAVHLRLLLRGLAELGVPIRRPRLRTCLAIAVGFSTAARATYAAVHGEAIPAKETVTVAAESTTAADLARQLRRRVT